MTMKENIRWHTSKEKGLWRAWLTLKDPEYHNKGVHFHWEIVWLRKVSPGFRLHFGDRGSETPFHWDVSFYWLAFFFSMNTPRMGAFFSKICGGHKRDISIRAHSGQMWWNIWYDDDMGYDHHHNHDLHKAPKFWPFRKDKYRPWICLRHGNIQLNPLSLWWGVRYYDYKPLDEDLLLMEFNQFFGDEYMVKFEVQQVSQARRYGPRFARRVKECGYIAEWTVEEGIPTRAPGRGRVYGSSVSIPNPLDWRMDADDALRAWVIDHHKKDNFKPFNSTIDSITPIFDGMHGAFLEIAEAGKTAVNSLKHLAFDFEKRLKEDGAIIITPENSEMRMGTTPIYNEVLKAQYTPAELAQQAINRDADPRTFFEQVADVQEIVDEANRKEN